MQKVSSANQKTSNFITIAPIVFETMDMSFAHASHFNTLLFSMPKKARVMMQRMQTCVCVIMLYVYVYVLQ